MATARRRLSPLLLVVGYGLLGVAISMRVSRWLGRPADVGQLPGAPVDRPELPRPELPRPELPRPVGQAITPIERAPTEIENVVPEPDESPPGTWVYEVDPSYHGPSPAPVERIIRARRTTASGAVIGEPIENPYYRPGRTTQGRRSRGRLPLLLVLVGAFCAAVIVWLVLDNGSTKPTARSARRPATRPVSTVPAATATAVPTQTTPPSTTAPAAPTSTTPTTHHKHTAARPAHRAPPAAPIRVTLIPTGRVYVCLVDATGRPLIDGQILSPGETTPVYSSTGFRLYTGNAAVELRVNGVLRTVTSSSHPAYTVRAQGLVPLPAGSITPCA